MVKVCLWGWIPVVMCVMILASVSAAPLKLDVEKGASASPSAPSSSRDADVDDSDEGYDYEYGVSTVQLLFAVDSAPRKIQKPCMPGYKPRRGKCRKVANIHRR